jgi:hypothetical protein
VAAAVRRRWQRQHGGGGGGSAAMAAARRRCGGGVGLEGAAAAAWRWGRQRGRQRSGFYSASVGRWFPTVTNNQKSRNQKAIPILERGPARSRTGTRTKTGSASSRNRPFLRRGLTFAPRHPNQGTYVSPPHVTTSYGTLGGAVGTQQNNGLSLCHGQLSISLAFPPPFFSVQSYGLYAV